MWARPTAIACLLFCAAPAHAAGLPDPSPPPAGTPRVIRLPQGVKAAEPTKPPGLPASGPAAAPPSMPSAVQPGPATQAQVVADEADDGPELPMTEFVAPAPLPGPEAWALETWFNTVGGRNADESFGALTVRVAQAALGRPYADAPTQGSAEVLNVNVNAFECVSFVESSLAVARCVWQQTPNATCFSQEIVAIRYRDGRIDGFPSRLHYFEDWLGDNARRGHMHLLAKELGGESMMRHTAYMTDHPALFPPLRDTEVYRRIQAMERHLSAQPQVIVMREMVGAIEPRLVDGDIIAVTTRRSNILVHHAGLVQLGPDRSVHLLHASSAHHKVTRTKETLAEYINRRPEREGIMVARPVPPPVQARAQGR